MFHLGSNLIREKSLKRILGKLFIITWIKFQDDFLRIIFLSLMILVLVGPFLRVYVRLLDRKCDSVASKIHLRNERERVIPFGGAVAGAGGWLVVQACAPRHGRNVLSKQLFVVVRCLAREIRTTHASGIRM